MKRGDLRVVVAPDSFKGTLSAAEAAEAIAAGWRRVRPADDLDRCPLSDGGDGLLDVVAEAERWEVRTAQVTGPTGSPVTARWLVCGDTALVESAEACGLHLVAERERDPRRLTTQGVGQLLEAARERDPVRRVLVGLGGSATSDGGIGLLAAVGMRLTDADGAPVGPAGAPDLDRVTAVDASAALANWGGMELRVLSDVTTVLEDAARVYGPQKGASDADVVHLTAGLRRLAEVVEVGTGRRDLRQLPGTGAAGGLGFALAALGAGIEPGAPYVADLLGLPARLADADLVIVGEGKLDETSAAGKVIGATMALAEAAGVPVAAVVGVAASRPDGLVAVVEAAPGGPGADPAAEVAAAAERLAHDLAPGTGRTSITSPDDGPAAPA